MKSFNAFDSKNQSNNSKQFEHLSYDDTLTLPVALITLRDYAGLNGEATVGELSRYLSNKLKLFDEKIEPEYEGEVADLGSLSEYLRSQIIELAKIDENLTIRDAIEGITKVSLEHLESK